MLRRWLRARRRPFQSVIHVKAPAVTPELLDDLVRELRRTVLQRTTVPAGAELAGDPPPGTTGVLVVDDEHLALGELVNQDVAPDDVAPVADRVDVAEALQAVTDTGVAECRCQRRRVHVTGGMR